MAQITYRKALRDITKEEYIFYNRNCICTGCENCPFNLGIFDCANEKAIEWVDNKNTFSEDFLNKTISWIDDRIQLSAFERMLLTHLDKGYAFIVREKDNTLYVYKDRPYYREKECWRLHWPVLDDRIILPYPHLFQFIQSNNQEPTSINDLLKSEEDEDYGYEDDEDYGYEDNEDYGDEKPQTKSKITLKEFFDSDKDLGIHCKTREEATKLLTEFNKLGKTWKNGARYSNWLGWDILQKDTCYYNDGMYDSLEYAKANHIKVYEFEEVIFDEEGQ